MSFKMYLKETKMLKRIIYTFVKKKYSNFIAVTSNRQRKLNEPHTHFIFSMLQPL